MEKYICSIIISFFVYGFAGWIWESFICPIITGHKIKNSGFLNGPIVPIYGVGALAVSLLFSPQETYISIFIEGAFVACVIEYFTSWVMETMYHCRWWDYSHKAFNVNGRVCLEGFLVFGLFSVIAVKFVQPALLERIMDNGTTVLIVLATVLTTILIIDLIFTMITLANLEQRLDNFLKDVEAYAQKVLDGIEINRQNMLDVLEAIQKKDRTYYMELFKQKKYVEKRIVRAFPQLINRSKNKK